MELCFCQSKVLFAFFFFFWDVQNTAPLLMSVHILVLDCHFDMVWCQGLFVHCVIQYVCRKVDSDPWRLRPNRQCKSPDPFKNPPRSPDPREKAGLFVDFWTSDVPWNHSLWKLFGFECVRSLHLLYEAVARAGWWRDAFVYFFCAAKSTEITCKVLHPIHTTKKLALH